MDGPEVPPDPRVVKARVQQGYALSAAEFEVLGEAIEELGRGKDPRLLVRMVQEGSAVPASHL